MIDDKYVKPTLITIHDKFLWTDKPHLIIKEAIKVVSRICDTRPVHMLKSVKNEVVMELTSATYDRRALTTKPITNPTIKYATIIIGHKIYFTNRENSISTTTIYTSFDMALNGANYDFCELLWQQLF